MNDSAIMETPKVQNEGVASDSPHIRFEKLKSLLRKELGETAFRSWISPLSALAVKNGTLEITVPTRFIRDWVRAHYSDRIRLLWTQNFGSVGRIEFTITPQRPQAAPEPVVKDIAPANQNMQDTAERETFSSPLDPRYTFDSFVSGAPNALAFSAARRLASGSAVPSPLFIYGGVGLGKTHLLQATAAALRAANPTLKVVYMSAERFMYQFVRALRAKDTMTFKSQLRAIDVFLVDDLQFICGKESTQEEFFHTFNALMDEGKSIVLSADRSPAELDGIDNRLRSRLSGGLAGQVLAPTPEMRLEILRLKCKMMNRAVPDDVLSFLADKVSSSVRELEGALNRLIAQAEISGRPVNLETAEELLQDLLRAGTKRLSIEDIQRNVAEHFNIRFSDMLSPRRARPVARPRQVAMYLCKALTDHSLPEIGRKFGGRDHTTIIHGVRKIEELVQADPAFRNEIETLKKALSV